MWWRFNYFGWVGFFFLLELDVCYWGHSAVVTGTFVKTLGLLSITSASERRLRGAWLGALLGISVHFLSQQQQINTSICTSCKMHLLIFSLCLCSVGCWVESTQPQLFIITAMKTYTLPLLHHTFAITLEFVFHLRHNIFSLFNIWTTEPRRQQRGECCQVFTGSKCLTDLMWLITQNLHYLNLFFFFFQFLLTTGSQGKLR